MKTLKKFFMVALLTITTTVAAFAQSKTKIIAVVKTAGWCSVCKANSQRVLAVLNKNNKDGAYHFVINDITDKQTVKESEPEIEKLGLAKAMEPYQATGVVYLFDTKTKKPINQLYMTLTNKEIIEAMDFFKAGKQYGAK